MRGVKLSFTEHGADFDWSAPARDFDAVVQNALVNVGTELGSDPIFPSRGTSLLLDAVRGKMVNTIWAMHTANFAALATLAFSRQTNGTDPHGLRHFKLQLKSLVSQHADLLVQATSSTGEVRGELVSI